VKTLEQTLDCKSMSRLIQRTKMLKSKSPGVLQLSVDSELAHIALVSDYSPTNRRISNLLRHTEC
jgi:hypothetical protein